MNKYKKLLGNTAIFAVGNLGSKLMQFIMIPLYSYTMNTSDFGKADVLTTIVNLLAPIVFLDISDAVFRFALDKDEDKSSIFNTGLFFIILISLPVLLLGHILSYYSLFKGYPLTLTSYLLVVTMLFSLVSNYARAIGEEKNFAVAGVVNTFVMGGLNILLLVYLKLGMAGYMLSMIWGQIIAIIYLIITCKLYMEINFLKFKIEKLKEMCKYSLPLIPNIIAWWLNSSSDRIFILMFLGSSMNGIYAMANKIPNMLSTFTSIFFQSWQISAVEEYNSKDSKKFISNVFNIFISFIFLVSLGILTVLKPLFSILISDSYYAGWKVVPFLLLALVYTGTASFLGTIYTATKKTLPIMVTTIYGAIVNVIVCLLVIKYWGINGTAIANCISFFVVSALRFKDIYKMGRISIDISNFVILNISFFVMIIINYIFNEWLVALIGIIIILILLFLNRYMQHFIKRFLDRIRK